jgi:hypothetical protein
LLKLGNEEDLIAKVTIDTEEILQERSMEPSLRDLKMIKIYDHIGNNID